MTACQRGADLPGGARFSFASPRANFCLCLRVPRFDACTFFLNAPLDDYVITEGVATRRQKTSMVYIARGPSGLSEKGFYIDGLT